MTYEIIQGILTAVREGTKVKLHCPGAFGKLGGYPVIVDGTGNLVKAYILEDYFSMESMCRKNKESIYLDGIENIRQGKLFYTDELIQKCKNVFGVSLMKQVSLEEIEDVAQFLITEIIEKSR